TLHSLLLLVLSRMRLASSFPLALAAIGVGSCADSFGQLTPLSRNLAGGVGGICGRRFESAARLRAGGDTGSGSGSSSSSSNIVSSPAPGLPPSSSPSTPASRDPAPRPRPPPPLSEHPAQRSPQRPQQHRRRREQASAMLAHTGDVYDGVTIDEAGLPDTTEDFVAVLKTSLEAWRAAGKKGVWLKVPAGRAELVSVSLDLGFELHHAEKAYIMLNMWLPPTENQLPGNASHQVGVGALVLNDDGDVLVVREKNGPLKGTGIWKFPTGLIDAGEDLPDAAAREVLEETGVETEFDSVLAFRHGHRGLFGKSDLFFVVRMRLKPGVDASALQPQESEIEECQWMPRRLFAQQNADSGTVLLRELSTIMEAHLASEEGHTQGPGTEAPGVGG
ncbi:unnamed protein product, partial [Scytosiphon promiscuus]